MVRAWVSIREILKTDSTESGLLNLKPQPINYGPFHHTTYRTVSPPGLLVMQAVRKLRLIIQPDPQLWVTPWIMMLTQNKGRTRRNVGRNEPGCDGSFQDHGSEAQ